MKFGELERETWAGFHQKRHGSSHGEMNSPSNCVKYLTIWQLLKIDLAKCATSPSSRNRTPTNRIKKKRPLADFYTSNFSDSPSAIFTASAIEFGEIENPYGIGSVNPWNSHAKGTRDRWFEAWRVGGGGL